MIVNDCHVRIMRLRIEDPVTFRGDIFSPLDLVEPSFLKAELRVTKQVASNTEVLVTLHKDVSKYSLRGARAGIRSKLHTAMSFPTSPPIHQHGRMAWDMDSSVLQYSRLGILSQRF